ncbi:MAG: branched-chain amino acid ABC transporter permease [Deltaproteobacteria bacterium]|nr:branched-chain amino acid ABC transporter permease [Deltaproteobacteria bacterium]
MLYQLIINGIIIGASYALMALGLNLIWSITDIPDFSQGGIYVFAAYAGYFSITLVNLPYFLGLLAAMCVGGTMAFLFEVFLYRRWRGQGRIQLLCAIALFFLLSSLAILFWTPKSKIFPPSLQGAVEVLGFTVSYQRILVLVIAFVLFVLIYFFIQNTKIGKAIRASSQDREVAEIVGININTVNSVVFAIGGMLSSTAAMGDLPLLKSLVVVILGGFGSVAGVLVGGIGLGLVESLGSVYISAGYQHGFAFFVLIIVLLLFPRGLFGKV